uniref:Uncharacterized protein n=1 Tax=Oryza punctata TaxID=4537 RepID=A0A0E0LIM5_ORYPU
MVYVEEYQNCFDRAPTVLMRLSQILYEEFQRIRFMGARLKSSQKDVVIKVLKPGIEDTLVADLNFIYVVAILEDATDTQLT